MAYFEDLTPYTYHRSEADKNVLNIGWLSNENSYPTGTVDEEILDKLKILVTEPVNLFRGVHDCEFCPPRIYEKIEGQFVGRTVLSCPNGNGEIRVKSKNGIIYVAPTLIAHYIEAHNYFPPEAFLNAISCQTKA